MFSNSTEGTMFTGRWCARCRFAYLGNLCDEAAMILFGEDPPEFLRRVESTAADPTGVVCDRFEAIR